MKLPGLGTSPPRIGTAPGGSRVQPQGCQPNGCTLSPDGWWRHCCDAHDLCYCACGTEGDRKACDDRFRDCLIAADCPLADIYYQAVRALGGSFWCTE